jgi:hypothetical protein
MLGSFTTEDTEDTEDTETGMRKDGFRIETRRTLSLPDLCVLRVLCGEDVRACSEQRSE